MQKWEQRIQISWQQERNRAVLGEERKEKLMVKFFMLETEQTDILLGNPAKASYGSPSDHMVLDTKYF